jgi:hypothetical protein
MIGRVGDLMPIRIETDAPFLRILMEGHITGADLLDAVNDLERLERGLPRVPDRIVDMSAIELETNFGNVMELAARRNAQVFPNPFRSAVVAPTPKLLGFSRMFQTLNTNPQIELRIFDTRDSAEAWLMGQS